MPRLGELLESEWARSYSVGLDLEPLKRALAQGVEPQTPIVGAAARAQEEPVGLTLQKSLEIALARNLGIRIATLSERTQASELRRARAKFHPILGLAASRTGEDSVSKLEPDGDFNTQQLTGFISQELPTGGILVLSSDVGRAEPGETGAAQEFRSDLKLNLVQPLFRGGRVFVATRGIRDAEFDLRIAQARLNAQVLNVTAETKRAYYIAVLAEKVVELTEAAIQRDKTLIEASEAMFKAGIVTKRDVFSAELIFATDSGRLASARGIRELAQNALLEILGLPIGTRVVLLDKEVSFAPVPVELEKWIARALVARPEILEIEQRLAKSALNVRVARNGVLPQLDLVGSYGRARADSAFGRSLDLGGQVWEVGLAFSIPFGNVAPRSVSDQAALEHARIQQELLQAKPRIELEVRAAVIKLLTSLERMRSLTAAIEHAKGKLDVARARFALGVATNLDITDAQEALLNAETDLLTAIVDHNVAVAELEARIGGPI